MSAKPLTDTQKEELLDLQTRESLTAAQKKKLASLEEQKKEYEAEQLEIDNVGVTEESEDQSDSVVYVFANLENGQKFKLPSGEEVVIQGMPVSKLKDYNGNAIPGGKYGVTKVNASAWEQVVRIYGTMRMFKNNLVFSAASLKEGKAQARTLGGLRHGFEQIDPNSERTKSTPFVKE